MPKKIINTTENDLRNVTLPSHGGKYGVISHGYIMDKVEEELQKKGLSIKDQSFRATHNGEVAQGVYYLNYGNDSEISLMFAWGNSYDKTQRFKCAVGAYVFVCGNGMLVGDMCNYGRKHLGTAKDDVTETIEQQIASVQSYFNKLVSDKDTMKNIVLTDTEIHDLIGRLYLKDEVITVTQLVNLKDELEDPSYNYGVAHNTLWHVYNCVTHVLKESHPRTWLEDQKELHAIIKSMFFPRTPFVNPNQLDLAVEAEKAEKAEKDFEIFLSYELEEEELRKMSDDEIRSEYSSTMSKEEIEEMIQILRNLPSLEDEIANGEYLYVDEDGTEILAEVPATDADVTTAEDDDLSELTSNTESDILVLDDFVELDEPEEDATEEPAESVEEPEPEPELETDETGLLILSSDDEEPNLDSDIVTDEVMIDNEELDETDDNLEKEIDNAISADFEMQEIKTESIIEEKEDEDISLDQESQITPIPNLNEPVQIMSPEEAKEKSEIDFSLDNNSETNDELESPFDF